MVTDKQYKEWHNTIRGIAARHYRADSDSFDAMSLFEIDDVEQDIWLKLCEVECDTSNYKTIALNHVYNLQRDGSNRNEIMETYAPTLT